ncbi:MAG: hypothetical protein H5U40_01475, partial [Polyangiaceae bacterium]|nr:hypothetical protein [Polyangiaceae bacterium]
MARERLRGFDVLLAVLAVGSVIPIWLVSLPPLQDFPQHVAAVRVLNDGWLPELGLDGRIEVDLSRTQYVAVYAAACALARI